MKKQTRNRLRLLSLLIAGLLLWVLGGTPWMRDYISSVKQTSSPALGEAVTVFAPTGGSQSPKHDLLGRIKREAEAQRIPPINAQIDRIWRGIPGLNGLEVDVEKTYLLAKSEPEGAPIRYVYKEVPPKVLLTDLEPQPIYRGNPKKPMISLMINVAWGDEYLPSILHTLEKENVHATFFFDGTWLSKHMGTAKLIGEKGHELSNHAYTHPKMSLLSRSRQVKEIQKTQALLEQIGVKNVLFAPPSGDFNMETVAAAREMGLQTILWTIDTVDWKKPSPSWVLRRVSSRLENGAMILMHPTAASATALPGIIQAAKKKGLAIGTVSELISPNRVPELETRLH